MPQGLTDDKSTLVRAMAWFRHLNQCWPRSPTPYGVTRPQWVNCAWIEMNLSHCWTLIICKLTVYYSLTNRMPLHNADSYHFALNAPVRASTPCMHVLNRFHDDDVIKWKLFRVTGPLCGEFTGHRWIPFTKASDAELWCFLWSAPH